MITETAERANEGNHRAWGRAAGPAGWRWIRTGFCFIFSITLEFCSKRAIIPAGLNAFPEKVLRENFPFSALREGEAAAYILMTPVYRRFFICWLVKRLFTKLFMVYWFIDRIKRNDYTWQV